MTRYGVTLLGALLLTTAIAPGCSTSAPENVHFGRGHVYQMDGRHDKAEAEYREVLTVKPDTPEVYFNLGQLAERRGDQDSAIKYYEMALNNYSSDARVKIAEAHMALGAIYFSQQSFDLSLDQFRQAALQDETDHHIHYNIGVVLEAIGGHTPEAIEAYNQSIELSPAFGPSHLSLAFIYEDLGEIETANMHHSVARQNGEDDSVLVERLSWWNDWITEEVVLREHKGEPRFEIQHPRDWRLGSAAQAGTTIVRTYPKTAAIIIGEQCSIQIVGPNELTTFNRKPADKSPLQWTAELLDGWIAENVKELRDSLTDDGSSEDGGSEDGGFDDGSGDGGEGGEEAAPAPTWAYDGAGENFSFANGTTGALQHATFTDASGRVSNVTFYFYLGEENSYVVVTTREGGADDRIKHGCRYVAWFYSELIFRR